jgi:hypothetical protein
VPKASLSKSKECLNCLVGQIVAKKNKYWFRKMTGKDRCTPNHGQLGPLLVLPVILHQVVSVGEC